MLVSAKEMLTKAKEGHYAVGQFNINNLEWTKAVLLTAEEQKSPVILGVSEGAGKYMCGYKTVDLLNSSFPYTLELSRRKDILAYLDGIYTSIVLKDIVKRKKITDIAALESLIRFMFDNIGNLCSATKIANTLKSGGKNISTHTVDNYLNALCESFVLYRVGRYDIKGKQFLQTQEKYYLADIGLRYYLLGTKPADMGHILENIVYLELLRRGNEIYIGKQDNGEVDFMTVNESGTQYYQVALTVRDETTLKRELAPLNRISDHNPKYLLTLDDDPPALHNGIRQINALDWLLGR